MLDEINAVNMFRMFMRKEVQDVNASSYVNDQSHTEGEKIESSEKTPIMEEKSFSGEGEPVE